VNILLRRFGLVSRRRHETLAARLEKAEARAATLDAEVRTLRERAQSWKAKADACSAAKAQLDRQLAQLQQAAAAPSSQPDAADRHAIALQGRLADAEREVRAARDELMTLEVKLDILEAAATVLDQRLRSALPDGPV
jgi:chromosome segregation ATPase